ncbi:centrosomal protein of 112 kDa [Patella vulgata]|uniref:centrosomal protein of 112 kDa n=1 Tax=Patella vulgata TaxID=6465 RepID=UPI0024A91D3E|nr:centrosomal protein of 112 kDa [Patella vulgata]
MNSMKEIIQQNNDISSDKIQETISAFLGDLCEHQDRILNAVREKENKMMRVNQLEKEISVRDATIAQLEKQLEERKEQDKEVVIKTLKKEIKEPTAAIDKKLSRVLDWVNEETDQSNLQMQEYKHQAEIQRKLNLETRQKQQKNMKDTEYRILEELNTVKEELKYRENAWQKQCLDELYKVQESQFHYLQKQLVNIIEKSPKNKFKSNDSVNLPTDKIEDMFKRQWESVEMFLETQFNRHFNLQEHQLELLLDKVSKNQEKSIVKMNRESDFQLTLPYFEDQFSKYHSDVKKQIENLHERHREEIKRIQNELQEQQLAREALSATNNDVVPKFNGLNRNLRGDSPILGRRAAITQESNQVSSAFDKAKTIMNPPSRSFQKQSSLYPTRMSPLSAYGPLSSRFLFCKPQPSPVAAVLPQRKAAPSPLVSSIIPLTQEESQEELFEEEIYEDFVESEEEKREEKSHIISKPVKKGKKRRKQRLTKQKSERKTVNGANKETKIKKPRMDKYVFEGIELAPLVTEDNASDPPKRVLRSSGAKTHDETIPTHTDCGTIKTISKTEDKGYNFQEQNENVIPQKFSANKQDVMNYPMKSNNTSYVTNNFDFQQNKDSRQKSIYQFEDECMQSKPGYRPSETTFTYQRRIEQIPNKDIQKLSDNKRSFSAYKSPPSASVCTYGSRESSPSMSLTEVVIKRKIKCDNKKTPDLRNFQTAQTYNYGESQDILATSPTMDPIFSQADSRKPYQDDKQESELNHAITQTRNCPNNHLKDNNNFVEITESIRRRTQRRYFQVDAAH